MRDCRQLDLCRAGGRAAQVARWLDHTQEMETKAHQSDRKLRCAKPTEINSGTVGAPIAIETLTCS